MNRNTYLAVALVVSAVLLVSTGAFDAVGRDDVAERPDIHLSPADGPNGGYALVDERGELELLLSDANPAVDGGVADDARTPLDRVFTVTYRGDRYADVWFSVDAESVGFYLAEDPSRRLGTEAESVRIGPDETVAVGLLVDTRDDHDAGSVDSFTVHATEPGAEGTVDPAAPATDAPTPTESRDPAPSPTPTATQSSTPTAGEPTTRTATVSPTPTGTQTPTPTSAPSGTPTGTDASTATVAPTTTPSATTESPSGAAGGAPSTGPTVTPPSPAPTDDAAAEDAPRRTQGGGPDPTLLAVALLGLVALSVSTMAVRWYR